MADFCEQNSAFLVISSSWRYTNDIQKTVDKLEEIKGFHPLIPYIIGQTSRKGNTRGEQIKDFVDEFGIQHYVIVDDDTDMRDDQLDHFVFVDSYYGLILDEYYEEMKERLAYEMEDQLLGSVIWILVCCWCCIAYVSACWA